MSRPPTRPPSPNGSEEYELRPSQSASSSRGPRPSHSPRPSHWHTTSVDLLVPPPRSSSRQRGIYTQESSSFTKSQFWTRPRDNEPWERVGWRQSFQAVVFSSYINIYMVLLPLAWVSHFVEGWGHVTFSLCFLSILPLGRLMGWGAKQLSLYLGEGLGDLVLISLNNSVMAALSVILLLRCELRLLQSLMVGVPLLHLLLVNGIVFLRGGFHTLHQHLDPHLSQLNHTLAILGALALVIPVGFFAALDDGVTETTGEEHPTRRAEEEEEEGSEFPPLVSDASRGKFLAISRGISVILLVIYIASRFYRYRPPPEDISLSREPNAHEEAKMLVEEKRPKANVWTSVVLIASMLPIMIFTLIFLVDSLDFVHEASGTQKEWFGLFLLPFMSFSADGTSMLIYLVRDRLKRYLGTAKPPASIAEARSIDLSIQYTLFWMPFLILLGWWTGRPISLLFDKFEVTILLASIFLVNYVTADAKTNWAEGFSMIAFYSVLGLCAWFYTGQRQIRDLSTCGTVVASSTIGGSE
ncbi:hypothetical protein OF83DRAFT_437581 [Amylostereum chailletii]|nr:hypothetical protein OF83DRAFT_437581 [Amylostereum chailletii]